MTALREGADNMKLTTGIALTLALLGCRMNSAAPQELA
jgi:hypothetical protein